MHALQCHVAATKRNYLWQDEAGNRVHLNYVTYCDGLEHAFSELYLGKDCYGNRRATCSLQLD